MGGIFKKIKRLNVIQLNGKYYQRGWFSRGKGRKLGETLEQNLEEKIILNLIGKM